MKNTLIGIMIYFSIFGCSDSVSPETERIVYFNSFDKGSDFEGWEGISSENWKNDVPNKKSKKSVFISGGCIQPHARYVFKNNLPQGYYAIECWGKAYLKTFGGVVSLKYQRDENYNYSSVDIGFSDSVWTYKISDTLFFDKSHNLTIEMSAGGIIMSAILVDNLIVKKIK